MGGTFFGVDFVGCGGAVFGAEDAGLGCGAAGIGALGMGGFDCRAAKREMVREACDWDETS